MNRLVKRTVVGFLVGAVGFGVVSAYQATTAGVALRALVGPLAFMMLIGGTIGALAGPLLGEGFARVRARTSRARESS